MAQPTDLNGPIFLDSNMNLSRALKIVANVEVKSERNRLKEQNQQRRALQKRFPKLDGIHPYLLIEIARLQDQYGKHLFLFHRR
jgi:hypothetical protein